jgi:hypothetical protein
MQRRLAFHGGEKRRGIRLGREAEVDAKAAALAPLSQGEDDREGIIPILPPRMAGMSKWVQGTVTGNVRWTDRLHSLQVEAPEVTFVAGQFGRLALPAPPGSKEEMLGRPYSFVNAPGSSPHEFYFVTVPEGPLSPQLAALRTGRPPLALAKRERLLLDRRGACRRRALVPRDRYRARSVFCRFCARPRRGRNSAESCWCMPSGTRTSLPTST